MTERPGFFYAIQRKKSLVLLLAAILLIFGVVCYLNLPKQEYPVIQIPLAVITTVYPGASAEDMEELVTKKIEDEAMAATGFDYCSSYSYDSVSMVQVFLELGLSESEQNQSLTDLRNKIDDLRETDLPSGVSYMNFTSDTGDTAGLILAFTGENRSNAELIQRAKDLRVTLREMPGVHKVEIDGEAKEQIEIIVDIAKLNRMNLSLAEIASLVTYQNNLLPAGDITFKSDKITVNTSGKFEEIEEIGNIILGGSADSGAVTLLKDIAFIGKAPVDDTKLYRFNGEDAVLLNLYYQNGINMVSSSEAILEKVNEYKAGLPQDIGVHTVINLGNDVNNSISNFTVSVIQAVIIVLVVIMLGMSLRNGGIVAVAIPISIMVPFIVMSFMGIDVQFISLAALIIALGMLVDNAVVVSDAIQVRIDNDEKKLYACVNGVKSVALPVLGSTMTTVCMFIMFYFLPGMVYTFAFSLPTIVISALVASYLVSILVTPIMCYFLMKKSKPPVAGKVTMLDRFKGILSKLLNIAFKHKITTIISAIVMLAASACLLLTVNLEFLPKAEKSFVDIKITTTNMNDMRITEAAVDKAVEFVASQPETTFYLTAVGGTAPKYDFGSMPSPDSPNLGNVVLGFDLTQGDNRFKETAYFVDYIQTELDKFIPGVRVQVEELGIIPNLTEPIQIRVTGDDFEAVNNAAALIEEEMKNTEGMTKVYGDRQIKTLSYFVDMQRTSLNGFGLTKAEVQNELNIALMGRETSTFRENTKEYPIVVKSNMQSTDDLANLMVKSSASGAKHQIGQIADIGIQEAYPLITRYNGRRSALVTASPGIGQSSITLQLSLLSKIDSMDLGDVSIDSDGDWGFLYDVLDGLITGAIVGLVGIILVLYMLFGSFRKTAIVICAIPFGFVGAFLGVSLLKPGFNLFTILGMLSLMGVVVNNAIVLVDYIDQERAKGIPIDAACKSAVTQRFRPVLLSTMTAVLGMLPLATGGNVLFRGMAVGFMCGDALAMFFTLIIIPVIYGAWEGYAEKKKAKDKNLKAIDANISQ